MMRLHSIRVEGLRCIEAASLDFGPGLNVLYGPNDLGKSTLIEALRAVLLLPATSSHGQELRTWGREGDPEVELEFDVDGRIWRVHKIWASRSGRAYLSWSNDGRNFTPEEEGRGVDGKLRELLAWGVKGPGGKAGPKGLPTSFLSTVLLGQQTQPYALFQESLEKDTDESGRQQLLDALEAMALDPLYKQVLESAQAKVGEAFSETGRRRNHQRSPFKLAKTKIEARRQEYEQLNDEALRAEAVTDEFHRHHELRATLLERQSAKAIEVEQAELDRQRTEARQAASERVARAQAALDDIAQTKAEVERLQALVQAADAELPGLEREAQAAQQDRQRWEQERVEAAHRVTLASQGASTETLMHRRERAQHQLDLAEQGLERWRVTSASRLQLEERSADIARLDGDIQTLREQLGGIEQGIVTAEQALAWRRYDEARRARESAEQAQQSRQASLKQATGLRAWAQRNRDEAAADSIPQQNALDELTRRHRDIELASAALGGGLAIGLELESGQRGRVTIDGGRPQPMKAEGTIEAQRTVELELLGVGRIRIQGGDPAARARYDAAQAAHENALQALLHAAGVTTEAELVALREEANERLREADGFETEAEQLERDAEQHRVAADALPECVERERLRLEQMGEVSTQAQALAQTKDGDALRAELEQARDRWEALRRTERVQMDARAQALAQQQGLRDRLAELERGEVSSSETEAVDWQRTVDEARQAVHAAQAVLDEQAAVMADAVRDAKARLQEVEHQLHQARTLEQEAHQRGLRLLEASSTHRGMLTTHRERMKRLDEAEAQAEQQAAEQALATLPEPSRPIDEDTLARLREDFRALTQEVEEAEAAYAQVQGKLQLIGGPAVRERADAALEALQAAQREEKEVELEYGAWQLLLETLRASEGEESQHLGRVLGADIGARFAELTKGRYAQPELSPQLQMRGVRTIQRADVVDIGRLSEGVKDQLATLLRIAVAQRLEGSLVLDDHLVQTDPARVAWFRDELRKAAQQVQIVVMTCRADDYLSPAERPTDTPWVDVSTWLRAIDLERVIERARPMASPARKPGPVSVAKGKSGETGVAPPD